MFPEGFMIGGFPFKGQKHYQAPVVAVQVDAPLDKSVTVICDLQGEDIEISDSIVASRAYGRIRIKDIERKS